MHNILAHVAHHFDQFCNLYCMPIGRLWIVWNLETKSTFNCLLFSNFTTVRCTCIPKSIQYMSNEVKYCKILNIRKYNFILHPFISTSTSFQWYYQYPNVFHFGCRILGMTSWSKASTCTNFWKPPGQFPRLKTQMMLHKITRKGLLPAWVIKCTRKT